MKYNKTAELSLDELKCALSQYLFDRFEGYDFDNDLMKLEILRHGEEDEVSGLMVYESGEVEESST